MADDEFGFLLTSGQARVATKRCKRCRKTKPITEFHYRSELLRHRVECKDCYRALKRARIDPEDNRRRVREWQKANPEKRAIQTKRNYDNKRSDVSRWIASNLRTTRASCKKKGIPCEVTATDLMVLYNQFDGKCDLTKRIMVVGSRGQQRDSLSIDRIEPAKGYVLGNVRLVTYQANMARGMFSDDELYAFCEAVLATRDASLANAAE